MAGLRRFVTLASVIAVASAALTAAGPPAPATASSAPLVSDPASMVNTLVGTTGGGNVFPGPDMPFGMVQWSPDSSPDRSDGGGYEYNDTMFRGFSLTHISGPGCGAFGDVPIEPLTGGIPAGTDPGSFDQRLSHGGEVGTAGYYKVNTGIPTITTELTATTRSAMARFTYPQTTQANLLFKLLDSQDGTAASSANIVSSTEVQGSATSGYFCGASESYTVHFDITFNRPFTASKVITEQGQAGPNSILLTFDTTTNPVLLAKVGISFVSADNAKLNWQTDNPGWNFDAVRAAAHTAWNDLLGKIQIGGSSKDREELFYTSLYHTVLHPNIWSDVNGQYMGFDQQVHTMPAGHAQYANYSGWDTYHSQSQLAALVAPQQASDQVTSLLNDFDQSGVMPQWGFANSNNYVMIGDPAQSIIADTYAFGARNFDTSTALQDMLHQATTVNDVRPGTSLEDQYGYLPEDGSYGCCNAHGFAASLLEYNQADYSLAQYAASLGDTTDATMLTQRAQNWQNIFNPADNFMETKYASGQFAGGYSLTSSTGLVEGSASQYRWIVPYNHQSLIAAMGGQQQVNLMLDSFFTKLDDGSGVGALLVNEFELGVQYFYDYTQEPWKTQEVVNRLRTQVFHDAPMFTVNNDDLGALSSQLAWSMLGFYPEVPGSAQLVLNGPEFPAEVIHLSSGHTITVNAPGASTKNFYIQSLSVNGQPQRQAVAGSLPDQRGRHARLRHGLVSEHQLGSRLSGRAAIVRHAVRLGDRLRDSCRSNDREAGRLGVGVHWSPVDVDLRADHQLDGDGLQRGDGQSQQRLLQPGCRRQTERAGVHHCRVNRGALHGDLQSHLIHRLADVQGGSGGGGCTARRVVAVLQQCRHRGRQQHRWGQLRRRRFFALSPGPCKRHPQWCDAGELN